MVFLNWFNRDQLDSINCFYKGLKLPFCDLIAIQKYTRVKLGVSYNLINLKE